MGGLVAGSHSVAHHSKVIRKSIARVLTVYNQNLRVRETEYVCVVETLSSVWVCGFCNGRGFLLCVMECGVWLWRLEVEVVLVLAV